MSFRILSPCGMLGYGYPLESFENGIKEKPHAIVVDAGSTDAGPHKLGAGVSIVSKTACKKDLLPMIKAGNQHKIPVIIGSAGGSGSKVHVNWTFDIVKDVINELGLKSVKVAIIWGDISKEVVLDHMENETLIPLGKTIPNLTKERLEKTTTVVAQMGMEPVMEALENKADIIICGRAYDPSPFAAPAVLAGYNPAYAYHLGKILECAALCAEPGTTKDCMLGIIEDDGFIVKPLSKDRICTKTSVAAHTFYEKDHPFILHGPGVIMNLEECSFEELGDGSVKVFGSKLEFNKNYQIKLEGAMPVKYRTFVICGIRDPLLIDKLEEVQAIAKQQVMDYYSEVDPDTYFINFINYGINGVMGDLEPVKEKPHEVGVMFEVLADTQDIANSMCATLRSTFLHFGYEGRKSTSGNLAFPFAPSDVPFGMVYEFSVYHLMNVDDGLSMFPIDYFEL